MNRPEYIDRNCKKMRKKERVILVFRSCQLIPLGFSFNIYKDFFDFFLINKPLKVGYLRSFNQNKKVDKKKFKVLSFSNIIAFKSLKHNVITPLATSHRPLLFVLHTDIVVVGL